MYIKTDELSTDIFKKIEDKVEADYVDVWWTNSSNSEGEEYYCVYLDDGLTANTIIEVSGWGEIRCIEEALEELE